MAKSSKAESDDGSPNVNQLLDMFIYAPIGMLYDYPEVLPQLIKKGKSQVQLAKVMGEFALRKSQADPGAFAAESLAGAGSVIAKLITELGDMRGDGSGAPARNGPTGSATQTPPIIEATATTKPSADRSSSKTRLPIANYDNLTAREIIGLLSDITPAQRARIRAHESNNRARKTVLSKLDQLGD